MYTNVYRLELLGGCSFSLFVWFVLGIYNPYKPTHNQSIMIAPSSFHHVKTASITSEVFFFIWYLREGSPLKYSICKRVWDVFEAHTFHVWCKKAVKWEEFVLDQLYCQMRKCFWLNGTNVIIFVCFSKAVLSNHDLISSREVKHHCNLFDIWSFSDSSQASTCRAPAQVTGPFCMVN